MSAMTTTPPSKPGWYWMKMPSWESPRPCGITIDGRGTFCAILGVDEILNVVVHMALEALWSTEPIEPPGESECLNHQTRSSNREYSN